MQSEFSNVGKRVLDLDYYLTRDVIFQYLRERRSGVKNAKVGILLAKKFYNEVYIGFSKCNAKDKFNLLDGLKLAGSRAITKSNPSIPSKHAREMANFISRSKRYFKGVSVFHYPAAINLRNENKIPESVEEHIHTECCNCNSHKSNGCNTLSGKAKENVPTECEDNILNSKLGRESLERAKKIFEERRERVKRTGEKDLMPEMMDSIMEEIANEEKAHTECTCKCVDREPDIAKILDDSFRNKSIRFAMAEELAKKELAKSDKSDKLKSEVKNDIEYNKNTYFTNAHIRDLNNRLKKVEEDIVSTNSNLLTISLNLMARVNKLELIHEEKDKTQVTQVIEGIGAESIKKGDYVNVVRWPNGKVLKMTRDEWENDKFGDYAYVIRHNGKVNDEWKMPLSDYKDKYLVSEIDGIYSDDLGKAEKYATIKDASKAIEEEGMSDYEYVVKVKKVTGKWVIWDGNWI